MIANIVLGMLLVWFACVLAITIRAGAGRREQDAPGASYARQLSVVKRDSGAPALVAEEVAPAQPEAVDVASPSLTL